MAQLKDTVISGSLEITNELILDKIKAPSASNSGIKNNGKNGSILESNGTSIYWQALNPSIVITDGTDAQTPYINLEVGGIQGTSQKFTSATTSTYGATKLTDSYVNTDSSLAVTGKALHNVLTELDRFFRNGSPANESPTNGGSASRTLIGLTTSTDASGNELINGAQFADISITSGQINETIPVEKGGTGFTTTNTVNAVVIGNSSSAPGTLQTVSTLNGAFYATGVDLTPQFGTLPVGQGGTGVTSIENIKAGKDGDGQTISSTYLKLSGGTLIGDTYFHSNTGSSKFYITRTGDIKESAGMWVDDSYFYIDVLNNETAANVQFKLQATDTEHNGGAGAQTSYVRFYGLNSKSTVAADYFTGNLTGNVTGNVTGSSGSCTGNAATATKFASSQSITLTGDTTGTVSSQAGWSITTKTDRLSTVGDNRSVATIPNDYANKIIFQGLKNKSNINNPSNDNYSYIIGLRGWADSSGGKAHEFAFNDSGIYHRIGSTTSWENWEKIITSGNYTNYTVTKTGSGASGTWGISITGHADQDLPLAGGRMAGTITFNNVNNAIAYTGTQATSNIIRFIDNTADTYGNGVSIGGGGATIIGGGESASTAMSQVSGGNEVLYLCNDGDVNVLTNMSNGWANRKTFQFGANGNIVPPAGCRIGESGGALYLGNSDNQNWVYIQDMCSQSGSDKWKILANGTAFFAGTVTVDAISLATALRVDQGGTGATTAPAARVSLGITPANIGAKATQTAISDPSASGTAVSFIDSITQNAQGVITPTKKTVANASTSAAGLMSADDKTKLNGIAAGAQVNSVTGVKGNAEGSYRTSNVNLTPANIGAVAKSGDTMTGNLTVQHTGDVLVHVKNTNTSNSLFLYNPDTGQQGLFTFGYWNGSKYVDSSKWLIYRSTDGNVHTDGVYIAEHQTDAGVIARCTQTNVNIWLENMSNGKQGLWSNGYWNGTAYVSSGKWLIHRNTAGHVIIDGNATTRENLGTYLYLDNATPATVYAKLSALNSNETVNIAMAQAVTYYLTGHKVNIFLTGQARKNSANEYRFMAYRSDGMKMYIWQVVVTASGVSEVSCCEYSGTTI